MTRPRVRGALVLAGLLALAAAGALLGPRLLERAADASGAVLPGDQAVATRATLTPSVHLFADPVGARLQVVVDRRRIDPASVRVEWEFAPYEPLGNRRVERRDDGHLTQLTYSVELRCLELACVPPVLPSDAGADETGRAERHTFRLPPARVAFAGEVEPRTVAWPPLEVTSRINAAAHRAAFEEQPAPPGGTARSPFAHDVAPAAPRYAVEPRLLASLALAGALLLLAVPARELVAAVRRRRRTTAEAWALLTPRERARLLAAWAAGRDDPGERRRALELAAAELGTGGDDLLAARARELAWSGRQPQPDAATGLAEALDGRGNGRAR